MGFQKTAGRIFTIPMVPSLRMQNSYSPTFKKCNSTLQMKYYSEVFQSGKRRSSGCSQLAQQLRRKEAQTSPRFFRNNGCTQLGANCFHSDVFFISKTSCFPLPNHYVTVNHWWPSSSETKNRAGCRERLVLREPLLCSAPGLQSNSKHITTPLSALDAPGSHQLSLPRWLFLWRCVHRLTGVPRNHVNKSCVSMQWSLNTE